MTPDNDYLDRMRDEFRYSVYSCIDCNFRAFGMPVSAHEFKLGHKMVREPFVHGRSKEQMINYPINILEHARSIVKDDWQAFAILSEAILAFKYGYNKDRVRQFALSIIGQKVKP